MSSKEHYYQGIYTAINCLRRFRKNFSFEKMFHYFYSSVTKLIPDKGCKQVGIHTGIFLLCLLLIKIKHLSCKRYKK